MTHGYELHHLCTQWGGVVTGHPHGQPTGLTPAQLSSALIILHHLASTLWTPDFRPSLNSLHSTSLAGKVNSHPLVTGNRGGQFLLEVF